MERPDRAYWAEVLNDIIQEMLGDTEGLHVFYDDEEDCIYICDQHCYKLEEHQLEEEAFRAIVRSWAEAVGVEVRE